MLSKIAKVLVALLLTIPIFTGMEIVYGETDVGANLITDVSVVNSQNQEVTTLDEDESFRIDLKWSLEGLGDLKAGDKATIILPVEIEGVNNSYELYDENGHLVVNVTQVGNQLTFVFTEFVEQNNNVHGDFYFWTKFSEDITVDQINQLDFETVNGIKTIPLFIRGVEDTGTGALLTKQGLYLGTQEPKRTIDWRIYINSYDTNKVSIKNGRFIDTLGPHQALISTMARVVYGPSVTNPTYVDQVPIMLNSDGTFEIPLRDTSERIYITYKTETDGSLEQYTNKGTIQALINDSAAVHTTTGYTPKYGGGGSGTGETSTSSESTTASSESTTSSTSSESTTTSSESSESTTSSTSSESTTASSASSESTTSSTSSESTTASSESTMSSPSNESTTNSISSESATSNSNGNSVDNSSLSAPKVSQSGAPPKNGGNPQLPQTGMTNDKWMILGGMLLISYVIYKRK
ncbi:LPXTG cell wall anchor domain-containing protein [Enterococcus gallinarum]|uniref:LPXTG cell wall anchor domain-containing protein n=1 Tax=Enterococcus gallinarum TaxID=1353 RepID=UPI00195B30C0|nr:LPXTG cell wall anchor domain-containing protein [Enterococcus gallinarum]MBM6741658.1 LPXTG cell wall anchor domain-containing protein [Enterococcus gallinarum]